MTPINNQEDSEIEITKTFETYKDDKVVSNHFKQASKKRQDHFEIENAISHIKEEDKSSQRSEDSHEIKPSDFD